MYLIPYKPAQGSVTLWCAHWDGTTPPQTEISVTSADGAVIQTTRIAKWSRLGTNGEAANKDRYDVGAAIQAALPWNRPDRIKWKRCYWTTVEVVGLTPATTYLAGAHVPGDRQASFTQARFQTLPAELRQDEPLTVFIGSCYDRVEDIPEDFEPPLDPLNPGPAPSAVAKAYAKLPDQFRPALKLFLGDQVYLDQPPFAFYWSDAIRSERKGRINHIYSDTWSRLQSLLQDGTNIMTTDDHDYWNDYPYEPFGAWDDLTDDDYRQEMGWDTRAWVDKVQNVEPLRIVDVGDDLSLCIVETRRDRSKGGRNFMKRSQYRRLIDWVENLRCPGVLALGNAIFWPPFSILTEHPEAIAAGVGFAVGGILGGPFGAQAGAGLGWAVTELFGPDEIVSDHNLTGYVHFFGLAAALAKAKHDILVVSGDVHFGRLASVRCNRESGEDPTRVWELLSSPLANLATSRQRPPDSPAPIAFPPMLSRAEIGAAGVFPNHIRYRKAAPTRHDDADATAEHFMTIGFTTPAEGRGVLADVNVWLVKDAAHGAGPTQIGWGPIWLDGGRLPEDTQVPQREVTQVIRGPKAFGKPGPILALANPAEPWSPRRKAEAIRDIETGLAEYTTVAAGGERSKVTVVGQGDKRYLRSAHDEEAEDNLQNLPDADFQHLYD